MLDFIRVRTQPTPRNFIPFLKVSYEDHRAIVAVHRIFFQQTCRLDRGPEAKRDQRAKPGGPEDFVINWKP